MRKSTRELWRSERRNIWERKTPTPSSSSLFSSWASPSFSFASPWLPSVIGPDSTVFVIVCVSASVWVTQQFGSKIWGGLRIWSPKSRLLPKWPKLVTPSASVCALSENTTRLSRLKITWSHLFQDTSHVHNCSPVYKRVNIVCESNCQIRPAYFVFCLLFF